MDYSHYTTKFLTDSIADIERMVEPMNNICCRKSGGSDPFYTAIGSPVLDLRDRVLVSLKAMRAELANRGNIKWDGGDEPHTANWNGFDRDWFNVMRECGEWVAYHGDTRVGLYPTKWEAMAACEVRNRNNEGM